MGALSPSTTRDALERKLHCRNGAMVAVLEGRTLTAQDERFSTLTGVPPSLLRGRRLDRITAWLRASNDDVNASLADVLDAPRADYSGEVRGADGRVVEWLALSLPTPAVHGVVFSFYETTHYHATGRALRDAESWVRMFTAHHDGVVLEIDEDARIVALWAAHAKAFLDLPESTLRGRTIVELLGPPATEFERRIRATLGGQASSFEIALDVAGERRVFAVNAAPLPSDAARAPSATLLVRDITQQARLKGQLEQAERLASVGLLAAGVAHEINNPLGYMLLNLEQVRKGLAAIARDVAETGVQEVLAGLDHSVEVALEGAQHVQKIVRDLKHFARRDDDEPAGPVDVHRVLRTTLEMVGPELERRARVRCDFGPVPQVLASEGRLAQVFLNLMLNATHAIPDGAREGHEIRIVTRTDDHGYAVTEVHDTGVGIPDHLVRHIFDPFFTTKAPGLGTGLGLAICHGITSAFGGFITVDSELGRGSVFRVVLPPAPAESKPSRLV
jgi:two-component system, NtrC family, sensor kinase